MPTVPYSSLLQFQAGFQPINGEKLTLITQLLLGLVNNGTTGYTTQQWFAETSLTDAATIAWDLSSNQAASVLLTSAVGATRALDNPTNIKDGASYTLFVTQSSSGSNAMTFGSSYKFPGGVAPTLTATANAVDVLTFIAHGGNMYGVSQLAFS